MNNFFPLNQISSIRLYYWLIIFSNCWFSTATWVFFARRYLSLGEIGLLDGLAFGFGLLLEIPTGAIADLIGRKRAIQLAMLFLALGSLIYGTSPDKWWLMSGLMIIQVGLAFYSGSVEAYAYDSLVDVQKTTQYDKVISSGMMLLNVVAATATFLGGLLYLWDARAPIMAWSIANWLGFILSFKLTEPKTDSTTFSWQAYVHKTHDGIKGLFHPHLRSHLFIMWLILSTAYFWDWGMLRTVTATYFGLPITFQATIFAVLPLVGVGLVKFLPWLRERLSDSQGLLLLTFGFSFSHFLMYGVRGWWGIIPLALIAITLVFSYPWTSVIINRVVESSHRATALSTLALITKIPFIVVSPLVGWLAEINKYQWFVFGMGCIFLIAMTWELQKALKKVE